MPVVIVIGNMGGVGVRYIKKAIVRAFLFKSLKSSNTDKNLK